MENITQIIDNYGIEHIIINRGNGEYTSMPKLLYDEMIAAQDITPTIEVNQ